MAAKEENIYDGVIRTFNGKKYLVKPWSFDKCVVNFEIVAEIFAELKKIDDFSIVEVLKNLDVVLKTAPKAVANLFANTVLDDKGNESPDINTNIKFVDAIGLLALVLRQNFSDPALATNLGELVAVFQGIQKEVETP